MPIGGVGVSMAKKHNDMKVVGNVLAGRSVGFARNNHRLGSVGCFRCGSLAHEFVKHFF